MRFQNIGHKLKNKNKAAKQNKSKQKCEVKSIFEKCEFIAERNKIFVTCFTCIVIVDMDNWLICILLLGKNY